MNNKHIFWIIVGCICLGLLVSVVIADPLKDKLAKDKVVKSTYESKDKKLTINMEKDNTPITIKEIDIIINQEKDKNKDKDIKSFSINK